MGYKETYNLEQRLAKSRIILQQYPDRVPVIVEPDKNYKGDLVINQNKFVTPLDLSIGQLQNLIRKKTKFPPEKALFLFINNRIYPLTTLIDTVYKTNKDEDGFLYVTFCEESTFG